MQPFGYENESIVDATNSQEKLFVDQIKELEKINKQLAKLILRKEELTSEIISNLDHDHEGQKTYQYGTWKIEVKTPFVYSLNKKAYESGEIKLPDEFNPIKESKSYTVDKKLCDLFMNKAPKKVRDALCELIEKKPGKPGINIKERV